ncbi:MAG: hypothetical protein FWC29_00085 [Methanomassiliicoccaceae archaeon]|nr:hypothetical protein [Methanomassiliicoccaceae archaeon]
MESDDKFTLFLLLVSVATSLASVLSILSMMMGTGGLTFVTENFSWVSIYFLFCVTFLLALVIFVVLLYVAEKYRQAIETPQ